MAVTGTHERLRSLPTVLVTSPLGQSTPHPQFEEGKALFWLIVSENSVHFNVLQERCTMAEGFGGDNDSLHGSWRQRGRKETGVRAHPSISCPQWLTSPYAPSFNSTSGYWTHLWVNLLIRPTMIQSHSQSSNFEPEKLWRDKLDLNHYENRYVLRTQQTVDPVKFESLSEWNHRFEELSCSGKHRGRCMHSNPFPQGWGGVSPFPLLCQTPPPPPPAWVEELTKDWSSLPRKEGMHKNANMHSFPLLPQLI